MEDMRPMVVNGRHYYGRVARVESASVGTEGHGILTVWVRLDYGGGGQGFGGYALDEWSEKHGRRRGTAAGTDYLIRLLKAFGAGDVQSLAGRYCYALADDDRHSSLLTGLAPLPMDAGEPFLIAEWREEWFPAPAKEAA